MISTKKRKCTSNGTGRVKRKKQKSLSFVRGRIAALQNNRYKPEQCHADEQCRVCSIDPGPTLFPYPSQCVAKRLAERFRCMPKTLNTAVASLRPCTTHAFFYYILHKPRGLTSMRKRGGGGYAAKLCRDFAIGYCNYANPCHFLHPARDGGTVV